MTDPVTTEAGAGNLSSTRPPLDAGDPAVGIVDFHSHLIPGVDDGATTLDESRAALACMQAQGIGTVVTTPHVRASLLQRPHDFAEHMEAVDAGWARLLEMAASDFPAMRLERGAELMLDVPRVDLSDARLRLAGGRFVLVEFPFFTAPLNSAEALFEIRVAGYVPIVAHPERYGNVGAEMTVLSAWRDVGARLQVNAGSLVGQYGGPVNAVAWRLLELGWADYISSDYHARGECATGPARTALAGRAGLAHFTALAAANPSALLRDENPAPVQELGPARRRWWRPWA